MFALRTASRIPMSRIVTSTQSRLLSSQGTVAIEKLRLVLDEYRQKHYTQEVPMRFKKDIARAAVSDKEIIVVEGMQRVLTNIGAEHRLSPDEMKTIFQELGNATGEIPMQRMLQIL